MIDRQAVQAVRVLHVIRQVSGDGGSRAAITLARYSARQGGFQHSLLSLLAPDAAGLALARQAGVPVIASPTPSERQAVLGAADIVQVHFWNTPELFAFLRADWPAVRLVVWLHVAGNSAPQMLTREVTTLADFIVLSGANSRDLPVLTGPGAPPSRLIAAAPDFERLAGLEPQSHAGFNVGYIGTVDFEKMHPDYVALHAQIKVPEARFIVCGPGGAYPRLRQQAAELGLTERFVFCGRLDDLRPTLSVLDVFGYPLRPDNYSAAEMALREAMYAGVPPVVFPFAGAGRTVTHNVTGLVAPNAAAYGAAIEYLFQHPEERARLGHNAQAEARRAFGPEAAVAQFQAVYHAVLREPKHARAWTGWARDGAGYFAESLGDQGADVVASQTGTDVTALLAAEARMAGGSPLLVSGGTGGILQYRNHYSSDAYLRLWAGLALYAQGRPALAVAEFNAAERLGLAHWRVAWYRARAAEACRAWQLAETSLAEVLAAAPDFEPAQALARRLVEIAHRRDL